MHNFDTDLQSISGPRRLHLVLELNEGDVVAAGDEADLLEAGELVEQHRQHHLIRLLGKVRQEQNLEGERKQLYYVIGFAY